MENKLTNTSKSSKLTTRQLVVIGMMSAICIVLGMTPLGMIPLPFVNATILHVPVIIGAIIEGPIVGALIGLIFGIFSFIRSFSSPTITAFIFMNPIISIVPRVLIGVVSYYVYVMIKTKNQTLKISIAAMAGSFANTIGVLGLAYLLYTDKLSQVMGISKKAVGISYLTVAGTNGVAEAIVAAIITTALVINLKKILKRT